MQGKIFAHKFSAANIMRKINPKCCNEDSFIYSIFVSLHYYDISYNRERIPMWRPYISNYDFTHTSASGFEMSLEIMDEDRNIIHTPSNTTNNKEMIIELENNRYAALKPIKIKYIRLNEILQYFSHKEISNVIMKKVIIDDYYYCFKWLN